MWAGLRRGLFAAALVLPTGPAIAQTGEDAGQLAVTDQFVIDEIEVSGGLNDVAFALAFTRQNGRVVVCAATASQLSGTLQQIKRAMVISESGRTIMRGIHWAPNYRPTEDLIGQQAACRLTTHPVPADPDFEVRLARTSFR